MRNWPKCLRREASVGASWDGQWLGFNLRLAVDRKGRIVSWRVTTASEHDLRAPKDGLLDWLSGVCFADSGYVSWQVRQDIAPQGLALIAKPRKNMLDERWVFDRTCAKAKAYRQRPVVEGVFSKLKNFFNLRREPAKTCASLRWRICASLAGYMALGKARLDGLAWKRYAMF